MIETNKELKDMLKLNFVFHAMFTACGRRGTDGTHSQVNDLYMSQDNQNAED